MPTARALVLVAVILIACTASCASLPIGLWVNDGNLDGAIAQIEDLLNRDISYHVIYYMASKVGNLVYLAADDGFEVVPPPFISRRAAQFPRTSWTSTRSSCQSELQ